MKKAQKNLAGNGRLDLVTPAALTIVLAGEESTPPAESNPTTESSTPAKKRNEMSMSVINN